MKSASMQVDMGVGGTQVRGVSGGTQQVREWDVQGRISAVFEATPNSEKILSINQVPPSVYKTAGPIYVYWFATEQCTAAILIYARIPFCIEYVNVTSFGKECFVPFVPY